MTVAPRTQPLDRLRSWLRRSDGPLTRLLARAPGHFGLGQLPVNRTPDAVATTVCGFCSTGCALNVHLRDGRAVGLSPTPAYPVNSGKACPKGWEALRVLSSPDRATVPLLRDSAGHQTPVDWPTAMAVFTERLQAIQARHGQDSVAFLSSGQIVTEEMALLGALAKFGMGLVHGDGNTRQCMATAVTAYKQSFGFDAPPYSYVDLEESDVVVLVGSNLAIAHPILWGRLRANRHNPQLIVVDPRATETAMAADLHLAPRPKSDLVLFYGVAHLLVREGWLDHRFIEAHTTGFGDFAAHVAAWTPERVAEVTGIVPPTLLRLATLIHEGKRVSFWWTMGVNQSHEGVRVAQALVNLALLTGNIGRPGTGANSITGQCNAMGSRLFSNTTNLFGGRDFQNETHRNEVAATLGIDVARIPDRSSLAYDQILAGVREGRIKALWIIATNTAHSWIDQAELLQTLDGLEFLVVQDMYATTETARRADLLLPAAGWGEKSGTFINSERRVGLCKAVVQPPGEALSDFAIFHRIATAWGCEDLFADWQTPEAVFAVLKQLSVGQPCDISGIADYRMLDANGGVQWPYTAAETTPPAPARRLFADGKFYHADARARFLFGDPRPAREPPCPQYPLWLLTGRGSAAQWHTGTRTSQSPVLRSLYPQDPYVEIHPGDASALEIVAGEWLLVESRRGSMRARAFVTPCVRQGQVFVPMHHHRANRLTDADFDPESRQPAYKSGAVRLRRIPWWEREHDA